MSMEHIIFSVDMSKIIEERCVMESITSFYWDAFGDLLDEVFLPNYLKLHESIKSEEGEAMKFYSFAELNKEDFNLAVKLIRKHLSKMRPIDWHPRDYVTNMSDWQDMAKQVWEEVTEPYIVLDNRYEL